MQKDLTIENIIESFKKKHPDASIQEQSLNAETMSIWPYIESPFFSNEEIDQLKDYYAESTDESYYDYFFKNASAIINYDVINLQHKKPTYSQKIIQLQDKMNSTIDAEEIDKIKQHLVDIGWNPEIQYTPESQAMARKRFTKLLSESYIRSDIIDISAEDGASNYISESNVEKLYPISIVLIQGDQFISKPIHVYTKCDFTHACIALDTDFNKLYSYNFDNKLKFGGGFSLESVRNFPKENRLGIYTFFVNKEDYNKLSAKMQEYLLNIKNTTYSLATLFTFPFTNVRSNSSINMICSQFVDSMMKLVNFDITSTYSSKVSPGTLYNSASTSNKVYKVYDGKTKDFDQKKTARYLNKLSKTAKAVNESKVIAIQSIILEAKKFNVEITDSGDVLLTNPIVNYDSEYMESHKLLMQYDKVNNIEGMKYELARLYYINYILEKKLYHNKFIINKEKNMKTRARVLNDFNKYMKFVLSKEPSFNFDEYYRSSVFYPHTIELSKSTVNTLKDIIKFII